MPALVLLRGKLTTGLKSGERGSTSGTRRAYSVLVGAEVALACALLVGSVLLIRTVGQMMETPTGVDADEVVTTTVQLASDAYSDWAVVGDTHSRIIERIRERPGVLAVGGGNFLPLEVGWRVPFGVYGLLSWSVALRTRELAIRMTLGADPRGVGGLVVRQSVALVVVGLAAGLALIRFAESALTRVLYQVEASDVGSALVASGLLLVAALIACVPPAFRAMRVDPVEGLRVE